MWARQITLVDLGENCICTSSNIRMCKHTPVLGSFVGDLEGDPDGLNVGIAVVGLRVGVLFGFFVGFY